MDKADVLNQICEYGFPLADADHYECKSQYTHLVISHEFPPRAGFKACGSHVVEVATQQGLSIFTVVDEQ